MSDSEDPPDRRSFLVGSVALAAGALLSAQACSTSAEDPVALRADFVALSSALTGVASAKLAAEGDTNDVAGEILAAAQKGGGDAFGSMLQAYRAHRSESETGVCDAVLNGSGAAVGFLAKSVMLAWLLGSWYDPVALQRASAEPSPGFVASTVISANAYRNAWAWRIAQTKAMGTTTAGFGHWASAPPPLGDFIGRER